MPVHVRFNPYTMPRFSLSLPADLNEWLEGQYGEDDEPYSSKAEAAREHLQVAREVDGLDHDLEHYREAAERAADLEREVESIEAERDDLQRQLRAVNSREDDVGELVEYVQEERSLQREDRARQRMKETAGVLTRAKWWVTGMPDVTPDNED